MALATIERVVKQVYRLAGPSAGRSANDRDLLRAFALRQEESAFAALVRRHGPMVYGACWRILRHHQDAEDAFQATFIVLARKAGSVSWQPSISNWLYGVATRLALKLRTRRNRRREQSLLTDGLSEATATPQERWRELLPVLDEELHRLPDKYRAPLVLCYLQGRSRDEAARLLGWTLPMVKGRLERGRNLLRIRLMRRGAAASAGCVALVLAEAARGAGAPPASLAVAAMAVPASVCLPPEVIRLTEEVTGLMFCTTTKTTLAAAAVATVCAALGLVWIENQPAAGNAPAPQLAAVQPAPQLEGERRVLRREAAGDERPEEARPIRGVFKAVDLKNGTITVTVQRDGEARRDETLSLAGKNIPVTSEAERKVTLADLRPGTRVTLALSPAGDVTAVRIDAGREGGRERPRDREGGERRSLVADLAAVDEAKQTVTIVIRRDAGDEKKVLPLAKEVRIVVGERRSKLGDLKAGERFQFLLSEDGSAVIEIRPFRRGEVGRVPQVRGTVKSVDAAKKQITITIPREGGGGRDQTYPLSPEVRVFLGERENAKLDDIRPEARVILTLDRDRSTVSTIRVVPRERDREQE